MPIIKQSFLDIFNKWEKINIANYANLLYPIPISIEIEPDGVVWKNPFNPFYIGMGNPNSDILFVGKEKANGAEDINYIQIMLHESFLNFHHWKDIVENQNPITNPFDKTLLKRDHPLNGFNPFNPLLYCPTECIVRNAGSGHTYNKIHRLLSRVYSDELIDIYEKENFIQSMFHKFFMTELNHQPARQNGDFKLGDFMHSSRYKFFMGNDFFRSFAKVIVHTGVNSNKYIGPRGSLVRFDLLKELFNNGIINPPNTVNLGGKEVDVYYDNNQNTQVIVCDQLSGSAGWSNDDLAAFAGLIH